MWPDTTIGVKNDTKCRPIESNTCARGAPALPPTWVYSIGDPLHLFHDRQSIRLTVNRRPWNAAAKLIRGLMQ